MVIRGSMEDVAPTAPDLLSDPTPQTLGKSRKPRGCRSIERGDQYCASRDLEPWLFEDETSQQALDRLLRELSVGLGRAVGRIGGPFEPWRPIPPTPRRPLKDFDLEVGWVGYDRNQPETCIWDVRVAPQRDPDPLPCIWDWLDSAALRLAKRHLVSLDAAASVVYDAILGGQVSLATRQGSDYLRYQERFSPSDVWVAKSAIVPSLKHLVATEKTWEEKAMEHAHKSSITKIVLVHYAELNIFADKQFDNKSVELETIETKEKQFTRVNDAYRNLPKELQLNDEEIDRDTLQHGRSKKLLDDLTKSFPELGQMKRASLERTLRQVITELRGERRARRRP